MTRDELMTEIRKLCPFCDQGQPVVSHLGGQEWIHSIAQRSSHSVSLCRASDLRVKHQDVLKNG